MYKILIRLSLIIFFSVLSRSQTSNEGNYEVYTREAYLSSFGYLTNTFQLPSILNEERMIQNGISFTHLYDITTLGAIAINTDSEFRVMLEGGFKVGAFMGKKNLTSTGGIYPKNEIKYYSANLDLFSLYVTPEFTFMFTDEYSVTLQFGLNLVNVGGTIAFLDGGNFEDHTVGVINIFPVGFRPSIFFDFGKTGLGIGGFINSVNILDFLISSKKLYSETRGLQSFDNTFRRSEFQIIFTF